MINFYRHDHSDLAPISTKKPRVDRGLLGLFILSPAAAI